MAPLPVIANTYRVELPWVSSGVGTPPTLPRNILHVTSSSTDVHQIGLDIGTSLTNDMFAGTSNTISLLSLFITPLDGVTAGQFVGITTQNPAATGEALPAVSSLVSLRTAHRGPEGRGRLYLGPVSEASASAGLLNGSNAATMAGTSGWGGFFARLAAKTTAPVLVVASYKHVVSRPVTSIVIDRKLATQRRRQDRVA